MFFALAIGAATFGALALWDAPIWVCWVFALVAYWLTLIREEVWRWS